MSDVNIQYLSQPDQVSMADDWFDLANEDHFWMKWRFRYLKKFRDLLPKEPNRMLEIGCGGGTVMKQFENDLNTVIDGCDLNEFALKKVKDISGKLSVYNIFDEHEQMVNNYEAILLLDVIEHIDDDKGFMEAALKHLKKDGLVIINVPALNSLFSKYDVAAGHVRRYNKKSLSKLLDALDLEIIDINYWGLFLLPIAYLRKLVLAFKSKNVIEVGFEPPNAFINWAFKQMMKLETFLIPKNFTGTSLMAFARKRS
ncbi:methyltransferase domain-containing protein [Reichenbachiella sp.]